MKKTSIILALGSGLAVLPTHAGVTTYNENTGTIYTTPALTGFTTSGDQMDGMNVSVTFSDGSVKSSTWATTGSGAGAAALANFFRISERGDTFNDNAWVIANLNPTLNITSFKLFGASDHTMFDRTFGGATGTTGSASGKDFGIAGHYNVTATYSDMLALDGNAPVGDEFETLQVDFSDSTQLGVGASTTFTQDADNALFSNTIQPAPDVTNNALLFGISLIGMVTLKRRLA
jgi:hypothetical protein